MSLARKLKGCSATAAVGELRCTDVHADETLYGTEVGAECGWEERPPARVPKLMTVVDMPHGSPGSLMVVLVAS